MSMRQKRRGPIGTVARTTMNKHIAAIVFKDWYCSKSDTVSV